jgi:hypothetical protein
MIIKVKRHWDGRIFTSDRSNPYGDVILEMHFYDSYTHVVVQDTQDISPVSIMVEKEGAHPSIIDTLAIVGNDIGSFVV